MFYGRQLPELDTYFSQYGRILAGTGSRSLTLESKEDKDKVLTKVCEIVSRFDLVLSGAAEGFDAIVAFAAHVSSVPYVLCVPNKGYPDYYWRQTSLTGTDRYWAYEYLEQRSQRVIFTKEDVFGIDDVGVYLDAANNTSSWDKTKGEHFNFVRNAFMVHYATEFVVYNPTSAGTSQCVGLIEKASLPYRVIPKVGTHQ